jgi:hypothetical protein
MALVLAHSLWRQVAGRMPAAEVLPQEAMAAE